MESTSFMSDGSYSVYSMQKVLGTTYTFLSYRGTTKWQHKS